MTTPNTEKRTRVRAPRSPKTDKKAASETVGEPVVEPTPTGAAVEPAAPAESAVILQAELGLDLTAPPEVIELDTPREGVPLVISTAEGLERAAAALASGTGPAAVDAERASGFRYGQRAFLVQIRREGSGTWLIDPEPFDDLAIINEALRGTEWILHAATQDLPCLLELGMWPDKLFDTELAARLAGLPRVGLAAVIEQLLGFGLAKEHSAADWSTRPLPEPWLRYAALDVEVLAELREELIELLQADGKLGLAEEEFAAILAAGVPGPRLDAWRRTSGVHQLRDRRQLAAVRELWTERDQLAQNRDVAPGRLIPDSALVAAAKAMPQSVPQLLAVPGFHGRAAKTGGTALASRRSRQSRGPQGASAAAPAHQRPAAAAGVGGPRSGRGRAPGHRQAPAGRDRREDEHAGGKPADPGLPAPPGLASAGGDFRAEIWPPAGRARCPPWQIGMTVPMLVEAFLDPDPLPAKERKAASDGAADARLRQCGRPWRSSRGRRLPSASAALACQLSYS